MRRLLPLLVVAAAVALPAPAAAADRVVERGVVQSIDPGSVVLRALDGSEIRVLLGPETRFRLNGRPATVGEIRPGFVAEAVTIGDGPARVLRAFGRVTDRRVRGRIVKLGPHWVVVRSAAGVSVRVPLVRRTTVWRADRRIRRLALERGMRVDVRVAPNGSARTILVLRTVR